MQELFKSELLKDEKILWTGQPDPKVIFTGIDILLVPFSLLWGGGALTAVFATLLGKVQVRGGGEANPWVYGIFSISFFIMGLYFIFGRFIYKAWKKRRTYYAVTNKRVIVLTEGGRRDVQAAFINTLPSVNKSIRSSGNGTIRFGNSSSMVFMYANTGMDFFNNLYVKDGPAFYDVSEADKVYNLVMELRHT